MYGYICASIYIHVCIYIKCMDTYAHLSIYKNRWMDTYAHLSIYKNRWIDAHMCMDTYVHPSQRYEA